MTWSAGSRPRRRPAEHGAHRAQHDQATEALHHGERLVVIGQAAPTATTFMASRYNEERDAWMYFVVQLIVTWPPMPTTMAMKARYNQSRRSSSAQSDESRR